MRYELRIRILDKNYIDSLITSLVRQGYNVYYNSDEGDGGMVCFTGTEEEVFEIKET